ATRTAAINQAAANPRKRPAFAPFARALSAGEPFIDLLLLPKRGLPFELESLSVGDHLGRESRGMRLRIWPNDLTREAIDRGSLNTTANRRAAIGTDRAAVLLSLDPAP